MSADVVTPGRYRHFKGADYEVLGVGRHSETEEPLVIYHPVDAPGELWLRPTAMWSEPVADGDGDGETVPRFRRQ